jgi:hypothetical protein
MSDEFSPCQTVPSQMTGSKRKSKKSKSKEMIKYTPIGLVSIPDQEAKKKPRESKKNLDQSPTLESHCFWRFQFCHCVDTCVFTCLYLQYQ